jgi:hypothetical protein
MLMLEISGNPSGFPTITIAYKLYGLFPLSEHLIYQMANGAKAVSELAMVFRRLGHNLQGNRFPLATSKEILFLAISWHLNQVMLLAWQLEIGKWCKRVMIIVCSWSLLHKQCSA